MKIAVEGCCHGELDNIYDTINVAVARTGIEVPDVLICCGDFQSFRNRSDLQTFAAPAKYRQLGSFWKYYNGEKTLDLCCAAKVASQKIAPILTIFVGGNHEASGYLWELYHGGWVAPNIYFLGFAGSVILKKELPDGSTDSIRISGASGIFKKHDYRTGHHERLPFDNSTIRSIYHVREYDIFRLSQLPVSSCDVFVSHDWPVGIEQHGKTGQLLRAKPFFRDEVATNTLGSPPLMQLLQTIKPSYWFSAHLHVKFTAMYRHGQQSEVPSPKLGARASATLNPDEVRIEDDEDGDEEPASTSLVVGKSSSVNPDMIAIDDSDEDDTTNEATPSTQVEESQGRAPCGSGEQVMPKLINRQEASVHEKAEYKADCVNPVCGNVAAPAKTTRFLALDKCLPRKDFLQILDIPPKTHSAPRLPQQGANASPQAASQSTLTLPSDAQVSLGMSVDHKQDPKTASSPARLFFDPDWLAITRAFNDHLPLRKYENKKLPTDPALIKKMVAQEKEWVATNLSPQSLEIINVQQFTKTAPGIGDQGGDHTGQPLWYTNPQTIAFADFLQIKNKINPPQD